MHRLSTPFPKRRNMGITIKGQIKAMPKSSRINTNPVLSCAASGAYHRITQLLKDLGILASPSLPHDSL